MAFDIPDFNELQTLTQAELNEVVRLHEMYLLGRVGGARAVVQYHDLSGLHAIDKNLSQADFTGCLMIEMDLSNSNFQSTSFFATDLRNSNLSDCNLKRADLRGAYVAGANLSGADMSDIDLREGKIMKRAKDGTLEDRKRSGGSGGRAVFSGAKLTETNMKGARAAAADFSDADLTGVIFNGAHLEGATFEGANLTDTDLSGASLTDVNMRSTIITGANLDGAEKYGLDMTAAVSESDMGAKLDNLGKSLPALLKEHTLWVATAGASGRQLDLSGYDLRDVDDLRRFPLTAIQCVGANFLNQDLSAAELQSGMFDRSDFRDCRMVEADLRGGSFKYAKLSRANLNGARLGALEFHAGEKTYLRRTNFSGANLRFASLQEADLRDAIFMGVDLSGANLMGCDLRRADFSGAFLKDAKFDGALLDDAIIELPNA